MNTQTITENQVNDFINEFCPFGYLDCKAAVEAATEAGYNAKWAAEQVIQFGEECGTVLSDCDPVYIVKDAILQEARNEISELTDYDFCNDCKSGEIYTYGNFMCTQYDYKEESKDELIEVLAKNDITIDNLSDATQYFLSELEIDQDNINAAK